MISNLPANETVTLHRIEFEGIGTTGIRLSSCRGRVFLQNTLYQTPLNGSFVPALEVDSCAQVVIHECLLSGAPALRIVASKAVVDRSTLIGATAVLTHGPAVASPAIITNRADLQLSRVKITGGSGLAPGFTDNQVGIDARASKLIIGGDRSTPISAGMAQVPGMVSAIDARSGSSLEIDARVPLLPRLNAPPIVGLTPSFVPIPTVYASSAPLGGTVTVDLQGSSGDIALLILSLPPAPIPVPGIAGELPLDPSFAITAFLGKLGLSGQTGMSVAVPNLPSLFAQRFAWQGVAGSSLGQLRLSNPSMYIHY